MKRELSAEMVSERLAWLRAAWRPSDAEEARVQFTPPPRNEPFDRAVARRLRELRELLELTRYLHGAR